MNAIVFARQRARPEFEGEISARAHGTRRAAKGNFDPIHIAGAGAVKPQRVAGRGGRSHGWQQDQRGKREQETPHPILLAKQGVKASSPWFPGNGAQKNPTGFPGGFFGLSSDDGHHLAGIVIGAGVGAGWVCWQEAPITAATTAARSANFFIGDHYCLLPAKKQRQVMSGM
jgi:hypothetical protein